MKWKTGFRNLVKFGEDTNLDFNGNFQGSPMKRAGNGLFLKWGKTDEDGDGKRKKQRNAQNAHSASTKIVKFYICQFVQWLSKDRFRINWKEVNDTRRSILKSGDLPTQYLKKVRFPRDTCDEAFRYDIIKSEDVAVLGDGYSATDGIGEYTAKVYFIPSADTYKNFLSFLHSAESKILENYGYNPNLSYYEFRFDGKKCAFKVNKYCSQLEFPYKVYEEGYRAIVSLTHDCGLAHNFIFNGKVYNDRGDSGSYFGFYYDIPMPDGAIDMTVVREGEGSSHDIKVVIVDENSVPVVRYEVFDRLQTRI